MLTVTETSQFMQYASTVWTDDERVAFINWIALNPLAGELILLIVYAKAKFDNLPAEFFKQLKEVFDD